jgi:NADPH-dependent F420 reductase
VQHDINVITLAVIGGTGKEGSGLAARWAKAGYRVIIGSRDAAKARAKVEELKAGADIPLLGMDNLSAVLAAQIAVLAVPYESHRATLVLLKDALQGKILIDVTLPLVPPQIRVVHLPEGKAASLEAQALLGDGVRVVTAYQHISYIHLRGDADHVDCDVLICGDDEVAKNDVLQLTSALGLRGIDAGPLQNAIAVESMGPMLLYINKRYKVKSSGIVITGIDTGIDAT